METILDTLNFKTCKTSYYCNLCGSFFASTHDVELHHIRTHGIALDYDYDRYISDELPVLTEVPPEKIYIPVSEATPIRKKHNHKVAVSARIRKMIEDATIGDIF